MKTQAVRRFEAHIRAAVRRTSPGGRAIIKKEIDPALTLLAPHGRSAADKAAAQRVLASNRSLSAGTRKALRAFLGLETGSTADTAIKKGFIAVGIDSEGHLYIPERYRRAPVTFPAGSDGARAVAFYPPWADDTNFFTLRLAGHTVHVQYWHYDEMAGVELFAANGKKIASGYTETDTPFHWEPRGPFEQPARSARYIYP